MAAASFKLLTTGTLLLALAIAIAANPVVEQKPITLPLTKHRSLVSYNIVESDQRRLDSLWRRAAYQDNSESDLDSRTSNIPATFGITYYSVSIGVGEPSTNYKLFIDSGSSNTWVGNNIAYKATSTSHRTDDLVVVLYGSGSFTGVEFTDKVTIGSLVITNQSIGVAPNSLQPQAGEIDGIIGIGPADLTRGTLIRETNNAPVRIADTIPTVTDNLFASGAISQNLLAVYFQPGNKDNLVNGEVSWGGIDASKFVGDIVYSPIPAVTNSNTSIYWSIEASVTYGASGSPLGGLSKISAIVDTGTTQVRLSSEAFKAYIAATGAVLDNSGSYIISSDQFNKMQNLTFTISGINFSLTPDAQILSRSLNTLLNGAANKTYLLVGELGNSIPGVDVILGMAFLERFYSVFDTGNRRVGLAHTSFTNAVVNSV